jgi:hypothetical protein
MFYRALVISLFLQATFVLSATASTSSIQGDVLGVDGRPLPGAEVRIERKDKKSAPITTRTNAKGYYTASGLSSGVYRISVVVDGAVKSAVDIGAARDNARVDFNMKPSGAQKVKHYVWAGGGTGSHLRGHWVEVEDESSVAGLSGLERRSGELAREIGRRQNNLRN